MTGVEFTLCLIVLLCAWLALMLLIRDAELKFREQLLREVE